LTNTGINLLSGDTFNVHMVYNGSTLTMTITDGVTNASYTTSWTINIPQTIGSNTAYVGFTGGNRRPNRQPEDRDLDVRSNDSIFTADRNADIQPRRWNISRHTNRLTVRCNGWLDYFLHHRRHHSGDKRRRFPRLSTQARSP